MLPPLAVQDEILESVKSIDDRITLLRETNTTLEAIAQALFKSWFVDFDPVHAKMQGRAPEGMDEATAALFPDSFEESELGPMPKGWRVGELRDIAKTVKKQLSPADLHAGLHYVGLEHIPRKSLSLVDWDDASGLESAKAAFSKGDVLFGKLRPYFHKVVIAPFDGVCSTDILVCQPTKPCYRGIATQHLFSDELISYADRLSNGAKMPRVNWGDLAAYQVVLPAEAVADAFSKAIDPLMERITHNVHGVNNLASLRDSLLPRLISGQLQLPEVGQLEESLA
jgi:type I restriction enzyme S subunit